MVYSRIKYCLCPGVSSTFFDACRYTEFKVVGNASVHLSGYYMPEHDHEHGAQLRPVLTYVNRELIFSKAVLTMYEGL